MDWKLGGLIIALLWSSSAAALDVDGYEKMKIKSLTDANEAERAVQKGIITGYFQGVGETLMALANPETGRIDFAGVQICLSVGTRLNDEIVMAATDDEIEALKGDHRISVNMPDWRGRQVAAFTVFGLAKMFPCK